MKKIIAQLGSNWNNGTNAGSFYWNLNNSVGNRNRNISGHLINCTVSRVTVRLTLFVETFQPCHLAEQ